MAKSQQKPKKVSGTRNSDRRNGKAFGRKSSKGKPSGRSIMGYARERVEKWAQEAGVPLDEYVRQMKAAHSYKKYIMKINRGEFARLIKGAESLYRDGTLVHKSMSLVPRQRTVSEVTAMSS